jgi:glyoxylase-like metal-dependent hydrolase (beta-lactamase superfamily II)
MEITTLAVSMFQTNCFLVHDTKTGEGVIIDPGDEGSRIIAEIERLGFTPRSILLTHGHGDHIGAVEKIKDRYNIPVYAGQGAEEMIKASNENFSSMYGVEISCPPPDHILAEGDEIPVGSEKLKVIATPGHSLEGICLHSGDVLFCGDTLFSNSIGRTDLPGGDHEQLIRMIKEKLLILPDETICYPGHGPQTTIGVERQHNPFLTGRMF